MVRYLCQIIFFRRCGAATSGRPTPSPTTPSAMVRKQLDERIPALIRNGVATGQRSVFLLVGDHARDQVVNLHYFLAQTRVSARPSVLWCYRKELGFSSNRQKRERELKRALKKGSKNKEDLAHDPFSLFVGVTDISYRYYKDSDKILGNTYGMLVLQDFEALTPNLLARTIETVEGGGVVVFLLKTMASLRQLYGLSMDVHAKYRSGATDDEPVARFNERFLLSLAACPNALVCDDELNVLPVSLSGRAPKPEHTMDAPLEAQKERKAQLAQLRQDVAGTQVVSDLLTQAATNDQGLAILTMLDVLSSTASGGDLSTTFALTAARGRGKSAALGLAIAASIAYGYANVFVTSPSPQNVRTLFQFLVKGLTALGYNEGADWSLVKGAPGTDLKDTILRVNVQRTAGGQGQNKQVIQYISPDDAALLGYNAELVVIDEAAAIPLPIVRELMGQGQYLVFLSSTISGYEGTGRSLSLKLLEQLRHQAGNDAGDAVAGLGLDQESGTHLKPAKSKLATGARNRQLKEVHMTDPIRYAAGDPVEQWLTQLLCLDAKVRHKGKTAPHPSRCELFQVNRDALFSFHPTSEKFLQDVMALYVGGHYKNSPNDMQLLSDAPGQRLFVLIDPTLGKGIEVLCVVQVALEGALAKDAILSALARGTREAGDLIPWLISSYYQDSDFAQLSGARVVRIATHPDYARMGYATRTMSLLREFYQGNLLDADALLAKEAQPVKALNAPEGEVAVRTGDKLPPLLQHLHETRPEAIDWLGVSYGLSATLFRFWRNLGLTPLYVRQTPASQTGEYTCVQVGPLSDDEADWLPAYAEDFRRRFAQLLGYRFRDFAATLAYQVLQAAVTIGKPYSAEEIGFLFSSFDLKRLEAYGDNMAETHLVTDLLPKVAEVYFSGRLRNPALEGEAEGSKLVLSAVQGTALLATGLQRKDIADVSGELLLDVRQLNTLVTQGVRQIVLSLRAVQKRVILQSLKEKDGVEVRDNVPSIMQELAVKTSASEAVPEQSGEQGDASEASVKPAEKAEVDEVREQQRQLVSQLHLDRYRIDQEGDWSEAEARVQASKSGNTTLSVKRPAPVEEDSGSKKPKAAPKQEKGKKSKKSRR